MGKSQDRKHFRNEGRTCKGPQDMALEYGAGAVLATLEFAETVTVDTTRYVGDLVFTGGSVVRAALSRATEAVESVVADSKK